MEKIFFLNTYKDYHVNGTNRRYWEIFFNEINQAIHDTNALTLHSSFNENMPIYEYYSIKKRRFVRIMQYNPEDENVKSELIPYKCFKTAWIDEREYNGEKHKELVVALLMTQDNVTIIKNLIKAWFFAPDKVGNLIKMIYLDQE